MKKNNPSVFGLFLNVKKILNKVFGMISLV